jgi:Glycosyltransferase family 92
MASVLERRYWSQLARAARAGGRSFVSQRPKRYYLAACLCFKDAGRDLAEWLEFHRMVGVEHFYLYNNESSDGYAAVLRPYQDAGLVTLHDWPGGAQQTPIYEHCTETYRRQARWIAYIDDDEFLFPVAGEDLRSKLTRYEDYAGIAVCRTVFGTSGHEKRPEGLVLESYTRRQAALGTKIKSIVNPL